MPEKSWRGKKWPSVNLGVECPNFGGLPLRGTGAPLHLFSFHSTYQVRLPKPVGSSRAPLNENRAER
jgi:hypothetical protein